MTGGEPRQIPLADPGFGPDERAAVDRVMRSGWISTGPETAALEDDFATAVGSDGAVAVSNGTAALHLALRALGVGPGDEVIVPSLSFVASAAAALMVGARPVLVDVVGPEEPTVAPDAVQAALSPRTRAIVAVHYGGWSARLAELRALADAAGAFLVEDAAHAPAVPSAEVPGRCLGTIGDAGCFSFHATKNVACGEGGMVVARDPAVLARVRTLRSHAMTGPTGGTYDVAELGFNHRPTDLTATIARVQLARLPAEHAARRTLTAHYRRLLADLPLTLPFAASAARAIDAGRSPRSGASTLPNGWPPSPTGTGRSPTKADVDGSTPRRRLPTSAAEPTEPAEPAVPVPADGEGPSAYHLLPIVLPEGVDRGAVQATLSEAGIQSGVHYPPIHRFTAYRGMAAGELARTEAVADRLLSLPLHGRLTTGDVARVVATLATALDPARLLVEVGRGG